MDKKYKIKLWFSNLKRRSLFKSPKNFDISSSRNLQWRELIYCSFNICWHIIIPAKFNKQHVPSTIVLIDAPISVKQMEWAEKRARELGYVKTR